MADDKPFIVPVVIDEVSQADARVRERFSELQRTRLPAGDTPAALVARVKYLLYKDAFATRTSDELPLAGAKVSSAAGESAAAKRGRRGLHRTRALVALAVIVIAGLVFLAVRVRLAWHRFSYNNRTQSSGEFITL